MLLWCWLDMTVRAAGCGLDLIPSGWLCAGQREHGVCGAAGTTCVSRALLWRPLIATVINKRDALRWEWAHHLFLFRNYDVLDQKVWAVALCRELPSPHPDCFCPTQNFLE